MIGSPEVVLGGVTVVLGTFPVVLGMLPVVVPCPISGAVGTPPSGVGFGFDSDGACGSSVGVEPPSDGVLGDGMVGVDSVGGVGLGKLGVGSAPTPGVPGAGSPPNEPCASATPGTSAIPAATIPAANFFLIVMRYGTCTARTDQPSPAAS